MISDIERIFLDAVAAVHPAQLMQNNITVSPDRQSIVIAGATYPVSPGSRIWILGAGKASSAMAREAEQILTPSFPIQGFIVTKTGHTVPLKYLEQMEAGHPVPDQNSVAATVKMQAIAKQVGARDIVLLLLSGGASALLTDVPPGSSLEEVQQLFEVLLKSGADIREMNIVRKHLSAVKGGQLARLLAPATVCTLALSDVVGDDLSIIGSGPTVADPSTFAESLEIIRRYRLGDKIPAALLQWLQNGAAGKIPETPKPGSQELAHVHNYLAGTNSIALAAAEASAIRLGYHPVLLSNTVTGNVEDVAAWLIETAKAYKGPLPACLLAGGETTVVVTGNGTGGRNQQLALKAGILAGNNPNIIVLSGGTDGSDGPTNAAGAIVDASTFSRAQEAGINAVDYLRNHDAWTFFSKAGGLLVTGPTTTNVMDLMIVLLTAPQP